MEERSSNNAIIIGILLVLFGVLSLLQNLGMAGFVGELVWGAAVGAGGAVFLYFFLKSDASWWASIPAGALLGLAMTIGAEELLPWLPDGIVGSIFLAMLGLGFLAIVLMNRSRWWAIIPGGALLSVAATAALADVLPEAAISSVLFLGLSATFAILALLHTNPVMRWMFVPAAVLGTMGMLPLMSAAHLTGVLWPLVLIGIGIALLFGSHHREIYR
ncbi:MAG: hypothetical protein J7463_18710 [Roseiflexus sp.]|jgi:hypothetical protein|nr:hypothetical protein [Roseiflexus sp.]MBO9333459.1 hypothetical protein [Roseiflexus sp.]MBO9365124.1 hypothetical protein [Roseiflexus sp.]MBO9382040.1 hypothetical protein [Roseiflexus sp.]MBO9387909.1 hypothetical protein [Roseiflexus sp.]